MRPLYSLLTDLAPEAAVFLSRVVRLLCFGFWDSASAQSLPPPRRCIQHPASPECPGQDLSIERWRALQRHSHPAPTWSCDRDRLSRGISSVENRTLTDGDKRTRSVTWKDLIALTGLTSAERRGASLDSVLGRKRPTLQENSSLPPARREGSIDIGGGWKVWP